MMDNQEGFRRRTPKRLRGLAWELPPLVVYIHIYLCTYRYVSRNGFRRRAPKRLSRTWTYPSTCSAVARPRARVRGALRKLSAISLSMYVNVIANTCVPAYKHTLIHINNI